MLAYLYRGAKEVQSGSQPYWIVDIGNLLETESNTIDLTKIIE